MTAAVDEWRESLVDHSMGRVRVDAPLPEVLMSRAGRLQRDGVQRRLVRLVRDALPTVSRLAGEDALRAAVERWLRETGCPERQFWRVPVRFAAWALERGLDHLDREAVVLDAAAWALRDARDPRPTPDAGSDPGGRLVFLRPSTFVRVRSGVAAMVTGPLAASLPADPTDSVDLLLSRRTDGRVESRAVHAPWRRRLEQLAASPRPLAETLDAIWDRQDAASVADERATLVNVLVPLLRDGVIATCRAVDPVVADDGVRLARCWSLLGVDAAIFHGV